MPMRRTCSKMTDDRFFSRQGPFSLAEIAITTGLELPIGAPADRMIRGVAGLETALSDEVSIFSDIRHARAFSTCEACAVITNERLSRLPSNGAVLLLANDPRLIFALTELMFYPRETARPGIHTSACIDSSAVVGEGCQIDCGVVIGPLARLGAGCHVGANVVIGRSVEIGDRCMIGANVTITHALIGAHVRIGAGSVIGSEGFGVVVGSAGLICSAQIGRVAIGDDVRIGANCTIDRGAIEDTVIGAGTMIDNLVQIAHNVRVGRNCIFAGQAGVAGSTTIGDNVVVGGQAAISDHLHIGSGARIAGKSGVMRDVPEGQAVAGYPAVPVRQWHRQTVSLVRSVINGSSKLE